MAANDDLIFQYYKANGFTGTLQDMEKQFYQMGGPLIAGNGGSIIGPGGQTYNTLVVSVAPSGDSTGTTDSAAIQAAINKVSSSGTQGGVVQLSGGVHYVKGVQISGSTWAAIQLANNVTLSGVNSPKIVLVGSTNPLNYGAHVLYGLNISNVAIHGIEIDGNRTMFTSPSSSTSIDGQIGSGVRLVNAKNVVINSCWIHSNIYHGILAVDGCDRVHTRFNRLNDNGYRAVHYNSSDAGAVTDSSINFNDVFQNGQASDNPTNSGIFLALGAAYRMECIGNILRDEKAIGIQVSGRNLAEASLARELIVSLNNISGGTIPIMVSASLLDSSVCGNIVSGGGSVGIQLGGVTGCRIDGNTVRRCAGPAIICGDTSTAAIVGCSISNNHFIDCDGSAATNRAAMFWGSGAHAGNTVNGNTFLNNGLTAAGATCGGIAMANGGNRPKSISFSHNKFINNKGSAIVVYNTDDCQIIGNQGTDNFEATGPRGSFIWLRGTCNNTKVMGNSGVNDGVSNTLVQFLIDATVTGTRVVENAGRCAAPNVFQGVSGSTGSAYGNTGTASWPVGFLTGVAAL